MRHRVLLPAAAILGAAFALAQSSVIPLHDPVAELNRRILAGKAELTFDDDFGYLRSLLKALDVPVESQMAVFSKTSVQAMRIEPSSPRTLFFNDSVVVGFVRGGFIELAAQDPQQGLIFYAMDQRPWVHQERMTKPGAKAESLFARREDCLHCHVSNATLGVPGALIRSVSAAPDGVPLLQPAGHNTDQRTPFDKLWGGWYVTGSSGSARHMGNTVISAGAQPVLLRNPLDSSRYLSPYSDIVALMVFEHQTRMMNLLTRIGWEARTGGNLRDTAKELVDYMLFVDEPPLPDRVEGTSGFTENFAAKGPRDRKGRSLREFDLKTRLMRYPCSYMIYSAAFDGLPPEAKDAIYRRMWKILSGEIVSPRLSSPDRRAIVEILRDTVKDLPGYFQLN